MDSATARRRLFDAAHIDLTSKMCRYVKMQLLNISLVGVGCRPAENKTPRK